MLENTLVQRPEVFNTVAMYFNHLTWIRTKVLDQNYCAIRFGYTESGIG